MDISKMREQFEEWCAITCRSTVKDNCGNYQSTMVDADWEAWHASREAVVVELPPVAGAFADVQKFTRNGCREAIEALGLKVAP